MKEDQIKNGQVSIAKVFFKWPYMSEAKIKFVRSIKRRTLISRLTIPEIIESNISV